MNSKFKFFLIGLFIANFSFAQSDTSASFKKGKYKMFVKLIEKESLPKKIKCYPIAINDSGLWITTNLSPRKTKASKLRYDLIFIKADNIDRMYFRRNGVIGIGTLVGSVAGIAIGAEIASASLVQPANSLDRLAIVGGGIIGLLGGAIIGEVTGAHIRKRFYIGGNLQNFVAIKGSMTRYLPNVRKS
jgi:hypothetical protein